jgi:hypothetical protein
MARHQIVSLVNHIRKRCHLGSFICLIRPTCKIPEKISAFDIGRQAAQPISTHHGSNDAIIIKIMELWINKVSTLGSYSDRISV